MEKTKPNFLNWHYSLALPEFTINRFNGISQTLRFFNISELFKNLFAPYKRITVSKKSPGFNVSGLFDQITFNITSIFVGASVRIVLILAGILAATFMTIFDFLAIPLYAAIPLFSLPRYLKITSSTFYDKDLEKSEVFLKKLNSSQFFITLDLFFDEEFVSIFQKLPAPKTLGLTPAQSPKDMICTISKNFPAFTKYLENKNIKPKQFESLADYIQNLTDAPKTKTVTPVGQMLNFGYTNTLDKFCTELTSLTLPPPSKMDLLTQIEKTLVRPRNNNVLLVGEPGVGRHTVLLNLTWAIQKLRLRALENKRVMMLDTIALSGTGQNLIEVKSNFEATLEEAQRAGNIILAIDQIDRIATPQDSRVDLSEVLNTVLKNNSLPIIGITTPDDFNKYIRPNGNMLKLFERIDLTEPTVEETINILIGKAVETFKKEGVNTRLDALIEIAQKSTRLVADRKQPEKSILLLEDTVSEAISRNAKTVDLALVDQILSQKTKTPVGKITENEAQKLKNLETILHKRIIGQDEAITEIASSMRRARAEIETGTRPIGSFLFLGPTGVGKTETAKALAEAYFGSGSESFGAEDRMVRLDMTEYQGVDSLKRLIGDASTLTPGHLTNLIRENPYGLLLVDEFEKADKDVNNLFLQILDEGFLTDAFGKRVSFDNIIIIATSNAGAEFIREQVSKESQTWTKPKEASQGPTLSKILIEYVLKKGLFTPELINRFDGVIVYHPLTQDQIVAVTSLMLTRLANNLKDSKNITLEVTLELAKKVAETGFDPTLGARPIRRLIQDKIEDGIAKMIISNEVKSGSSIDAQTLLGFVS